MSVLASLLAFYKKVKLFCHVKWQSQFLAIQVKWEICVGCYEIVPLSPEKYVVETSLGLALRHNCVAIPNMVQELKEVNFFLNRVEMIVLKAVYGPENKAMFWIFKTNGEPKKSYKTSNQAQEFKKRNLGWSGQTDPAKRDFLINQKVMLEVPG